MKESLNLTMYRAPAARTMPWTCSGQQLLRTVVPLGMAILAWRRRTPSTWLLLAASGLAALTTRTFSTRRRFAREAALDDQIEQSFPASDAPAH